MRNDGRGGDDGVVLLFEIVEELAADLLCVHKDKPELIGAMIKLDSITFI